MRQTLTTRGNALVHCGTAHAQSEPSLMLPDAAAATMPSAEAMTVPRLREQCRPPARPDRRPSPWGGHPSPSTASAAARPAGLPRLAGARRGLVRSARVLAARSVALTVGRLLGALALPAPAQAQTTGICDRTQKVFWLDEAASSLADQRPLGGGAALRGGDRSILTTWRGSRALTLGSGIREHRLAEIGRLRGADGGRRRHRRHA